MISIRKNDSQILSNFAQYCQVLTNVVFHIKKKKVKHGCKAVILSLYKLSIKSKTSFTKVVQFGMLF